MVLQQREWVINLEEISLLIVKLTFFPRRRLSGYECVIDYVRHVFYVNINYAIYFFNLIFRGLY